MFSGIVETTAQILSVAEFSQVLRISIEKPDNFNDLCRGDSIAVNGVCLTLEDQTDREMVFALAAETLQITKWNEKKLQGAVVNLERSLAFGDRVHGHLVTGHVDASVEVLKCERNGESLFFEIKVPENLTKMIWTKGSATIDGVSLTINEVSNNQARFCIIPETLKRTRLSLLQLGDRVNLEVDWLARAYIHYLTTTEATNFSQSTPKADTDHKASGPITGESLKAKGQLS